MRADRRSYFVLRLVGYLAMDVRPEFLDQGQLESLAAPDWLHQRLDRNRLSNAPNDLYGIDTLRNPRWARTTCSPQLHLNW